MSLNGSYKKLKYKRKIMSIKQWRVIPRKNANSFWRVFLSLVVFADMFIIDG